MIIEKRPRYQKRILAGISDTQELEVRKRRMREMAISGKYGKIDIPKVGEDEPVCIIRAQDNLAQRTIEMYRTLTESHKCQLADTLQQEIESFRQWKGNRKLPD